MHRCPQTRAILSGLLWLGLAVGRAQPADVEEALSGTLLTGESLSTARRLDAADKLAAQKRWADALDDYQHILDEAGDDLVPLDVRRRWHCVRARRLCHLRIAALPAKVLRLYRGRIDDQAAKWLKKGAADRDPLQLRRVVDEAFCSRPAEEALELLGDLAFERGDFEQARHWWRMLALPLGEVRPRNKEPAEVHHLLFPDPDANRVARVRAKQLIARLFQGDGRKVQADLKAYRSRHGQAAGHLAGSDGNYAATVARLLRETRGQAAVPEGDDWTSFAGGPARNLVLPRPLPPRIGAHGWKWSVRLDTGALEPAEDTEAGDLGRGAVGNPRALAFQPLIAGNLVLWADARFVNAHDLLTGRRVFRYDLLTDGALNRDVLGNADLKVPARHGLRYTLSVAGDRVYARLGSQGLSDALDRSQSFLVCLDLRPEAKRRELWRVAARVLDRDLLAFEGAPLVHSGKVYAVLSRLDSSQTRNWIACYEAESGKLLWRQEICATRAAKGKAAKPRYRHHLLTLAGTNVVYCTHAGAVVALDAATGQRAWAVRYLSRGPRTADEEPSPRDLAPPLAAGGRVFAAPLDSDRLLCLDANTGRTLWERDRLEVVHLLGVDKGRLVFTTPEGIRAVPVATGADRGGWAQPTEGKLPAFGRGFLAGGWVFWPTAAEKLSLRALNVADGSQEKGPDSYDPSQFHRVERGNLVFSNGCLVVAGTEVLYVYVPEERYLPQRRAAAGKKGAPASALYRLALAEAGAGQFAAALEHFGRAERAPLQEHYRREPVRLLARRGRHRVLLQMAALHEEEERWQEAADLLERAAGAEFPAARRLQALSRLGQLWTLAGRPAQAVVAWQRILDDAALRRGHLRVGGTRTDPAGPRAAAEIRTLIRRHGSAVYAASEKRAEALLDQARNGREAAVLERLTREFPNASVTGPALLRLARLHDQANRPAHAARAYRLFLGHGPSPPASADLLAEARAGLAQAYERQHCWEAALSAWQDLAERDGDRVLPALDGQHTVREFVARRLQQLARRSPPRVVPPQLQLPLLRVWPSPGTSATSDPDRGQLLIPDNRPRTPVHQGLIFFVSGTGADVKLHCREAGNGKVRWQQTLDGPPSWASFRGEAVVVAGATGVCSLALGDGKRLWEFTVAALPLVSPPLHLSRLSAFHRSRTRLFFLQGEARLLALDMDSGRLLWSYAAPSAEVQPLYPAGRLNPLYHAGEKWVVLQTGTGRRLVLDSQGGRVIQEGPAADRLWERPALALADQRLLLVPDPGRVVLFDPASGKEVWSYSTAPRGYTTAATGEAPRLFAAGQAVLVLLARNYGYQLERLDPRTGVHVWKMRARISREAFEPDQVGCDAGAVYYVTRNVLHARALADGKLLWSRPLSGPAGTWRAVACGGGVMVYPTRVRLQPHWSWVPLGGTALALPVRIQGPRGLPVLFCDPKDGQLLQRLNFPAAAGTAVQTLPHRLVVEVGGQAWGLRDADVNGGEGRRGGSG
jgi:outer membrane protein assembly factor BamB/tetratricopeptide (TPR) repeat protein